MTHMHRFWHFPKKLKRTLIKRFYYICKVYNIEDYLENNIATCRSDKKNTHTTTPHVTG
jgi:hypothetical protein